MALSRVPPCKYCGSLLTYQPGLTYVEQYHCTTCHACLEIVSKTGEWTWLTPLTQGPWELSTTSADSATNDTKR